MKMVIGIDVGGSTTKICGFTEDKTLIGTESAKAGDPVSALYGAFGKFTSKYAVNLSDVEKVLVTGVGHNSVTDNIYGIPASHISEFDCIGLGGKYLAKLKRALVVSIGTGTAMVYADENGAEYIGGTGVGGGTIAGLANYTIGVREIPVISSLAEKGDLSNVNLRISDITSSGYSKSLGPDITAANFGKISDIATKEDVASGIFNLVFETVGMLGVFASKNYKTDDIVLLGHLPQLKEARHTFDVVGKMFDKNFIIPENSTFGTVIGAALSSFGA